MIHNPQEEKLFKENTDPKNWTEDNYPNPALAGTPVALSDLVVEHHARLHHALDDELCNPTLAEAGDVAAEPDSDNVGY